VHSPSAKSAIKNAKKLPDQVNGCKPVRQYYGFISIIRKTVSFTNAFSSYKKTADRPMLLQSHINESILITILKLGCQNEVLKIILMKKIKRIIE
jgi:hypothetical protein